MGPWPTRHHAYYPPIVSIVISVLHHKDPNAIALVVTYWHSWSPACIPDAYPGAINAQTPVEDSQVDQCSWRPETLRHNNSQQLSSNNLPTITGLTNIPARRVCTTWPGALCGAFIRKVVPMPIDTASAPPPWCSGVGTPVACLRSGGYSYFVRHSQNTWLAPALVPNIE